MSGNATNQELTSPQKRLSAAWIAFGSFRVYNTDMKIQSALRVMAVTAAVVIPAIIGESLWPAQTKWGFTYSLTFSVIGGMALGILVERFAHKQKSRTVNPQ